MLLSTKVRVSRPRPSVVWPAALALASGFWLAGLSPSHPLVSKLDGPLAGRLASDHRALSEGGQPVQLIVQTRRGLTPAMERQFRSLGGRIKDRFRIIQGFSGTVPPSSLSKLAGLGWVDHLSSDMPVRKMDDTADPAIGSDIANGSMGLDGSGVTVAVLDSGIQWSPDLLDQSYQSRVIIGPNFSTDSKTTDLCGHGTHVAGLIAGSGLLSTGPRFFHTFKGVAPGVRLVNVKILNSQGQGTVSSAINGLQWCVQNQANYNIRVINLSMGHPVGDSYVNDPLCQAVEAAWKSGIVVVCAAGNSGRSVPADMNSAPAFGTINSPGNDPYVITVGATKTMATPDSSDDQMASYSSHGPTRIDHILKPDLVAPGNRVVSILALSAYLNNWNTSNAVPISSYCGGMNWTFASPVYFRLSGTSMSTALVSGAAALLLEQNPSLNPDTVKARLMKTARKHWNPQISYSPLVQGAGLVNIPAALMSSDVASGPALSPIVSPASSASLLVPAVASTWGNCVIWGDSVIWSDLTGGGTAGGTGSSTSGDSTSGDSTSGDSNSGSSSGDSVTGSTGGSTGSSSDGTSTTGTSTTSTSTAPNSSVAGDGTVLVPLPDGSMMLNNPPPSVGSGPLTDNTVSSQTCIWSDVSGTAIYGE